MSEEKTVEPRPAVASLTSLEREGAAWQMYGRRLRRQAFKDRVMFVVVLLGALVAWHLFALFGGVERFILPTPIEVAEAGIDDWSALLQHSWATAQACLIGFALAAVAGIVLAGVMSYFRVLEQVLSPVIVSFQTLPKVALAPLFVVWFGFSMLPRVLVTVAIAFFPIVIDTMVGLKSVRPSMLESAKVMGASRWQVFWKVELPSALPNIFGGLKVAATLVVIGAVVGEYIVSNEGLGYIQLQATAKFDTPLLFSALILMALIGLVLFEIVGWVERLSMPWRRARSGA